MPLALSLEAWLGPWIRGPLGLQGPYLSFLDRQAEVIARARGAFLVRWFGSSLPLEGLSVRVAFANLTALVSRARSVSVAGRESTWDQPNLTEPLAGMAGTVVGMWANPLNSLLLGAMIATDFPRWWTVLLAGLNHIIVGALGMAALFVAGVGGGVLLAVAGLAGRDVPPLVGLLGSVASLARPATAFWGQISGPRSAVRNPVLREMLAVFDSLAALVPHLFGAAAIVITRAMPQLPAVAALIRYGQACGAAVVDAIEGTATALKDFFVGPQSPLAAVWRALGVVGSSLERSAGLLRAGWAYLGVAAASIAGEATAALSRWKASALPGLGAILPPVLGPLKAASQALSAVGSILSRVFSGPPGPATRAVHAAIAIYHRLAGPPSPPLPPAPSLGGFGAILAPFQQLPAAARPPAVPPDLDAALRRLGRPPQVVGEALAELEREQEKQGKKGGTAATPVADLATYLEVARRLVPPAMAGPFADLQHKLADLPVLAAPSVEELRVRVGALRVRVPDSQAAAVRTWSTRLSRAMGAHVVTVPAPAAAAARAATAGASEAR